MVTPSILELGMYEVVQLNTFYIEQISNIKSIFDGVLSFSPGSLSVSSPLVYGTYIGAKIKAKNKDRRIIEKCIIRSINSDTKMGRVVDTNKLEELANGIGMICEDICIEINEEPYKL